MLSFLKKRIEANQGISISKLPGHMSSLPPDIQVKHGWNEQAIRKFIEKHPGVFLIDNSGRVFLRPSPKTTAPLEVATDDVTTLCGVSGKVLRIFPNFGFVTVEQPFKTTVYFDVKCFEDNRHTTLTSAGLSEGDCVILDATKSVGHKASFKATRMERIEKAVASASKLTKEPSAEGDDRLYNQSGIIHTVKPDFGFITFGPKKKSCAFFHSSVVDKALTTGSRNLADILTTNDRVCFDAKPDSKGSKWVKWKATRVWCAPPETDGAARSENDSGDEVFMSEDEADMESILNDDSDSESSNVDVGDYPVGFPDWECNTPRNPLHPGDESSAEKSVSWSSRRTLSGIKGIFFKQSDNVGCICSVDGMATARAVISTVYHAGRQIKSFDELPWSSDVKEGVEVFFDAVEDGDKWLATLVWSGNRPPKLPVKCSEFTFNAVRAAAKDERRAEDELGVPRREAAQSVAEPSIEIFPDRRGVVVSVAPRVAWCEVKEDSGSRRLKFTSLYRDGAVHKWTVWTRFCEADDVVSVDYMVGTSHDKEEARCSLVWQGKRPLDAASLSPEDFVKLLCARAAERGSSSSSPQQPLSDPDVVLDVSQHNGSRSLLANAFAEQMLDIPVCKQAVAVQQPRRASTAKQTGAHTVLNANTDMQRVSAPTARTAEEPSISIYPSVRGTVVGLLDCIATIKVQEAEGVREIVFTSGYFYKDGKVVLEDLNEVLHEGDEVNLNYMVARMPHKDVVHCDLVWQGRMPGNADCLSPEVFAKSLGIKAASGGVRASVNNLCRSQQQSILPESVSVNHIGSSTSMNHVGTSAAPQIAPAEPRPAAMNSAMQRGIDVASPTQTTAVPLSEQHVEQLAEEPQANSTRPGSNESCEGPDNTADCIPPAPSEETLLRLARMVVLELKAEFLDEVRKYVEASMQRSRILVRDAESQTNADRPRTDSAGESTPPFFSPCSTPTRELDATDSLPSRAESVPRQPNFSATAPEDAVATQPPELQKALPTYKTVVSASCEPDDNGGSQRLARVRSQSGPDTVKTSDVKLSEAQPSDSVPFKPLAQDKVMHTINTASGTSCEQDPQSKLQLSAQVLSGRIADAVASSDETADIGSTASHPIEGLVMRANYIEELAAHIISKALAASDKPCATSERPHLSEAAAEGISSAAECHSSLPQSGSLDRLQTEDNPEEAAVDVSKPVNEIEETSSKRLNDSADSIVLQGVTDGEGDNLHTDMVVSQATENDISVEAPGPVGGVVLQETAKNELPDSSEMAHKALVEALQPTAETDVPGTFEMLREAVVDVTSPQQTAEGASDMSKKTDGSAASVVIPPPTGEAIPLAASNSDVQPASSFPAPIENDSASPSVLPDTTEFQGADSTQKSEARLDGCDSKASDL
ncbi:uncharacterized protein LOC119407197 [Rhipicephalus sanguineus]|uniref:uncharacterized protein LOC119407197 n=1 Tax=Rhipicephalus sanguineus TaxID=34632 RepID=UPI0018956994|nr:uncharacterized protein LOC119407197 [Rhipicephalus sanguineus]